MTLRDNKDTGYDSEGAARANRELRRGRARVGSMRESTNGGIKEKGGDGDGGEGGKLGIRHPWYYCAIGE